MTPLVFDPIYSQLDLPERHRFPIDKYQGIYDRLRMEGVPATQFLRPKPLDPTLIAGALCPDYIRDFASGRLDAKAMRRIGFPWSEQLVRRTLTAVAGTLLTGQLALERGRAINLTGGYHHAFYDYGAGFCIVNDLYLCALQMLLRTDIQRVLIFDCDVHQGDGTACLAGQREDIFTVSIHGEKNFPFRKQASDIDVALPSGTADEEYLNHLEATFAKAIDIFKPDAVIYDAGVDVHIDDDLGHFNISTAGLYARDSLVVDRCDKAGLPLAAVIGGGYQRDIPALVDAHLQLFKAALPLSSA